MGVLEENERRHQRSGRGRNWIAAVVVALIIGLGSPVMAMADEYAEKNAGHPLRMIAYVLHPVGVVIDYVLMRPAHWLVSHEPLKTLFGHED